MTLATLRFRRDSAANWASANPILSLAEIGWETDTGKGKIGDGASTYAALPYSFSGLPWDGLDVTSAPFGAMGDGIADDTAAITAAVAALPAEGGTIYFPPGTYKVTSTIDLTKPGIRLLGGGRAGYRTGNGPGDAQIVFSGTGYALTFATSSGTNYFNSITIDNLMVSGSGSSPSGGIWIGNCSDVRLHDVTISDFRNGSTTAIGLRVGNDTSTGAQYGEAYGLVVKWCDVGVYAYQHGGFRIIGGYIEDVMNPPRANTCGIRGDDTLICVGTVIQGFDTLVELKGEHSQMIGCRYEGWNVTAIKFTSTLRAVVQGGSYSNFINGSGGTVFTVDSGSSSTFIKASAASSYGTLISDAGTNTVTEFPILTTSMVRKTRGGTNVAVTSTSFTALDSSALDIALTGVLVGDWVEVGLSMRIGNEAEVLEVDARTLVSGSAVNSVGQQNSSTPLPTEGVQAWYGPSGAFRGAGGSVLYKVVSGDLSTGNVLNLRLYVRSVGGATKNVLISDNQPVVFWARNHGKI